ncbi:MAG: hypothetical protein H6Q20_1229 [Bacteroidetes bacterium]|nr:hypothetical protein [Bacteroidota bacterium]
MKTETIHDIPQEKVQNIVMNYQSEGYSTKVIKQANGLFTIIATKE